ncbi:hypothetical protein Clacol_004163 [Clathrus columnatus]|uniref:Isocitrate lyase n=1 Tax=Clathrus columnatus TaxID=1419009 RepID=A0AAV5AB47_9AGAM|nr:hypothetical protein Clacol_004163 [Clathrus columnatus]
MLSLRASSRIHGLTLPHRLHLLRSMSSSVQLPIKPLSVDEEADDFNERVQELNAWFNSSRFKGIKRPYTASSVVSKQGSYKPLPLPSTPLAEKLFRMLQEAEKDGKPLHTIGVIDPIQMTQMAERQEVVYISGWACSSTLVHGSNDVGPDLADYPYTTVPNQVHRIFRAQQLHDRKHYDERFSMPLEKRKNLKYIDYLRPILADGDTGHGGLSAVMKITKLFAESCGHQGGKVVVPTNTHISRLVASRFQLDILQSPCFIVARTDADSARLISSNIDPADHEFILGTTIAGRGLAELLAEAEIRGASGDELDAIEAEWMEKHQLVTFDQAVQKEIDVAGKGATAWDEYKKAVDGKSNSEARLVAREILGKDVFWDWDIPRTKEGFYHTTGGNEAVIKRLLAFAPYADMLWYETNTPTVEAATRIARLVREKFPGKQFVYNLSPSFNWAKHGFNDETLKTFIWDIAKEGYAIQLISLGGLHNTAVATASLSKKFETEGMLAYVNEVQQRERDIGCDVLTHQKWWVVSSSPFLVLRSGANYVDRIITTVQSGNSSTAAGGKDSTEHTF